jgi:hypothetical protein
MKVGFISKSIEVGVGKAVDDLIPFTISLLKKVSARMKTQVPSLERSMD